MKNEENNTDCHMDDDQPNSSPRISITNQSGADAVIDLWSPENAIVEINNSCGGNATISVGPTRDPCKRNSGFKNYNPKLDEDAKDLSMSTDKKKDRKFTAICSICEKTQDGSELRESGNGEYTCKSCTQKPNYTTAEYFKSSGASKSGGKENMGPKCPVCYELIQSDSDATSCINGHLTCNKCLRDIINSLWCPDQCPTCCFKYSEDKIRDIKEKYAHCSTSDR